MNGQSRELPEGYTVNRDQSRRFSSLLVAGMMVCVAVGAVQLGQRIVPTWHGMYLVWIAGLVSLEAIFTRPQTKNLEGRDRWIFHISEWVAFAVVIKLLQYLLNDPAQLLADIPRWQQNFVENFFTGEYVFALGLCAAIWLATKLYSRELDELHEREDEAQWDELGKVQNTLHTIRDRIASRVFMLGALVVALAVFTRVDASGLLSRFNPPDLRTSVPVINVLVYFVLGLVLMSQNQFNMLRTRWLWQKITISSEIARNWVKYGLIAFLALAVLVFFLPTNYSIGLFDTLRYSLDFIVRGLTFLFMLIMLPITFCLSLFNWQTQEVPPETEPPTFPTLPPAAPAGEPILWWEVLKSLLFWGVFLGIIIFALRYYLMQNAALWAAITGFPLFRWIGGIARGLWDWLRGANRAVANMVRGGLRRARKQTIAPAQALRRIFNLNKMTPRERIIHFYLNLIELGGERGLGRKPAQTPYQYEQRVASQLPEIDPDLHSLTDTFLEARYSQHPVEEQDAAQANSLWEKIKATLRSWKA